MCLEIPAPAILAAAVHLAKTQPDAVMLVAPSDHVITDREAFHEAVAKGLTATAKGDLVTFGIQPTRAETGYGYLEIGERPDGSGMPIALRSFVEKPDAVRAEEMLATGNYLWNAGIFLFAVKDILAAFERHTPELFEAVNQAFLILVHCSRTQGYLSFKFLVLYCSKSPSITFCPSAENY